MNQSPTISTVPYDHPSMDYEFLRREGIRHLERMAGRLWTDFNAHDPGITILEQVCYAITDLAYRINYDMPDLLASADDHASDALFGPARILPTHPVTLNDLRKLVIDVPGVKNCWVETFTPEPVYFDRNTQALSLAWGGFASEPVRLKGLYRVLIELDDLLYSDGTQEDQEAVKRLVVHRLHQNRGLCTDYETIEVLNSEPVKVRAHLEIEAIDDAEAVLLAIFQGLTDHVSPPVRRYTLRELLDQGVPVDDIFDGPLLAHGFIRNADLERAQRRTELRTSDLIQVMMDIPGVRAVRMIQIANGSGWQDWTLPLNPDLVPKFSIKDSDITLERNSLITRVNMGSVRNSFDQQRRNAASAYTLSPDDPRLQPPPGRDRNTGSYYSIQHQFPPAYGIGGMGLPASATPQRQAQAKQLKAYLMFFDQLLANYFAQLGHVGDLLSASGDSSATYFSQVIADPDLGLDEVLSPAPQSGPDRLQQITEDPYDPAASRSTTFPGIARRNRFLNHLLARFAEQFTDYTLLLYGAPRQELVEKKKLFLKHYPQLSSARGTGFNYLEELSETNRSGLEKRIQYKLGLDPQDRFYLVEHVLLRPMPGDAQQSLPILEETSQDPYSLQLSFVLPREWWQSATGDPNFKEFVENLLREETPAHLKVKLHWLDANEMNAFRTAYQDWAAKRRAYWMDDSELEQWSDNTFPSATPATGLSSG